MNERDRRDDDLLALLASPRSSASSNDASLALPLTPTMETGPEPPLGATQLKDVRGAVPADGAGIEAGAGAGARSQLHDQLASFSLSGGAKAPVGRSARAALAPQLIKMPEATAADFDGPKAGFSFGTCPSHSQVLGTPRAELGPFEYPVNTPGAASGSAVAGGGGDNEVSSPPLSARSSFSSQRVGALALGETHRRGSIIARPATDRTSYDASAASAAGAAAAAAAASAAYPYASFPEYRRSSTTGTINTLPVAGRRPSILHSTTIPSTTVPQAVAPVPSVSPTSASAAAQQGQLSSPTAQTVPSGAVYDTRSSPLLAARRGSLMFQPKNMPAPIPPSLLARRSSIPASQLYAGLPIDQLPPPPDSILLRKRASVSAYAARPPFTTTSHALYQRRSSVMSDGAESTGTSTNTVMGDTYSTGGDPVRRASVRYGREAAGTSRLGEGPSDLHNRRRMSLPHAPFQPARDGPLLTGRLPASPTSRPSSTRASFSGESWAGPSRSAPDPEKADTAGSTSPRTGSPRGHVARLSQADRRARNSVDRGRLSFTSSLSSSEESAEEDGSTGSVGPILAGESSEVESLPTPGSVSGIALDGGPEVLHGPGGVGFSDPWAKAGAAVIAPPTGGKTGAEGEQGAAEPRMDGWGGVRRRSSGSGGVGADEWAEVQRRNRVSTRGRPSLETIPSDSTARASDEP